MLPYCSFGTRHSIVPIMLIAFFPATRHAQLIFPLASLRPAPALRAEGNHSRRRSGTVVCTEKVGEVALRCVAVRPQQAASLRCGCRVARKWRHSAALRRCFLPPKTSMDIRPIKVRVGGGHGRASLTRPRCELAVIVRRAAN